MFENFNGPESNLEVIDSIEKEKESLLSSNLRSAIFASMLALGSPDVSARASVIENPADFMASDVSVSVTYSESSMLSRAYKVSYETKSGVQNESIVIRKQDLDGKSYEEVMHERVSRMIEAQESSVSKYELVANESDIAELRTYGLTIDGVNMVLPHLSQAETDGPIDIDINPDTAQISVQVNHVSGTAGALFEANIYITDYDGSVQTIYCRDKEPVVAGGLECTLR